MNINSVSFGRTQDIIDVPSFVNENRHRPRQADSFQRTVPNQPVKKAKKSGFTPLQRFMAFVLSGGCVAGGGVAAGEAIQKAKDNAAPYAIVEEAPNSIQEFQNLEAIYDVSGEAICYVNGVESFEDIEDEEIKVPAKYDPQEAEIAKLEKELRDKSIKGEERAELVNKLTSLKQKQAEVAEEKAETAETWTDGKWLYIKMNSTQPAWAVKSLYGIEDGALKKHNHLEADFVDTEPDPNGHSGMWDYTNSPLEEGKVYKVKLSELNQAE